MDPNPESRDESAAVLATVVAELAAPLTDAPEAVEVLHIVLGMAPHPPKEVALGSRLVEDLGYDSLRLIELTVALEERFDTRFEPEVAARIRTLEDVTRYVASLTAES